ncbi:MAG: GntR family transcriptional regulator [Pseudomonadota bacterium]|jgi:DNA-binding GntR family transcriptional regulator
MTESTSQTRAEWLADQIASAIMTGELPLGMRLNEHGLAERYGVSRTPVREALRHLAVTGLIEARARRGAAVAKVSSEQLEELFVAMGEMEATCARLAAMSMTPIERRRLVDLHRQMDDLVTRKNENGYSEANVRFHVMIYHGAHNPTLADIATGLRTRLAPFRRAQFQTPGRLRSSHAEHGLVVDAILRGDALTAHSAMLNHVNLVEDAFEKIAAGAVDRATPKLTVRKTKRTAKTGKR